MTGPNEALRQIEEAQQTILDCYADSAPRKVVLAKLASALASLRSLLEGDEEQVINDTNLIIETLQMAAKEKNWDVHYELDALSRLSAKAKIGEAEIREAKREVWEEVFMNMGALSSMGKNYRVQLTEWVFSKIKEYEPKAALKEAGK